MTRKAWPTTPLQSVGNLQPGCLLPIQSDSSSKCKRDRKSSKGFWGGGRFFHSLPLLLSGFNQLQHKGEKALQKQALRQSYRSKALLPPWLENAVWMPTPYAVFAVCAITNIQVDSCEDTEPALVYHCFLTASVSEKTWHWENGKICLHDHRPSSRALINHFWRRLHKSDKGAEVSAQHVHSITLTKAKKVTNNTF